MIRKLLNLIYEALGRMMGYKSITDALIWQEQQLLVNLIGM